MIVKIGGNGTSFTGLATYLTHDPEAETSERVAWTHTLNLANDHVPSAVDEMLWTARQAELLKQEAGIRAGGRTSGPEVVKHISLNWAPDEEPSREHMIETAEDFLRQMKWQDHQALLVAHEDKEHAHVHLMLNCIHPETGLRLSDSFEQRRAQTWALDHEREQGRIYCEQRMLEPEEREDAPTRPAWMAFRENQRKYENEEKALRELNPDFSENQENPRDRNSAEWKRLKEMQRSEREEFFADGKAAFSELRSSVYRDVRDEFRGRWRDYYATEKAGADAEALKGLKAELVADQKAVLEERRDEACAELRETRNGLYRELLDEQRDARHGLRERQELQLDNSLFFSALADKRFQQEAQAQFHEAAEESTRAVGYSWQANAWAPSYAAKENHAGIKSGTDIAGNVATGLGFGLLLLAADFFDSGESKPEPKPQAPEPDPPRSLFDAAFEESRQRQQAEREEADSEWYRKQRSAGE